MRVTIIPFDNCVYVDGVSVSGLDLSFIDPSVHAVQWYGNTGEVEIKDPQTGKLVRNELIDSIAPYQAAIDAWDAVKNATPVQPEASGVQDL